MINTYTAGQAHNPNDAWLLSNWGAGQTLNMEWQADNVSKQADGTTVLTLDRTGISKPYAGGEIQSADADTFGTWEYIAKAPQMVDGAVFGMFLYQADYRDDWLEFDFEFVGKDTTEVQVTVHMEDPSGKHIAAGKVVDLWFDAAQEFARYTISVDHDSAEFFINGRQVAQFTARDMPDGQWDTGPMKSYVDLWSADSRYTGWTGTWTGQNLPLKGYVWDASTPGGPALTPYNGSGTPTPAPGTPGDPTPADPAPTSPMPSTGSTLRGTEGNDTLNGTAGDDTVDGLGGSDLIRAGAGNDVARGGEGTDRIAMDLGNDLIDGGGTFWDELFVEGSTAVTIDLARTTAQVTGLGTDTILNIENVSGGSGHDQIFGDGRWNLLKGGVGNDLLDGRTGQDRLEGGAGRDEMRGGADGDRDVFIFASVGDSAVGSGRDVVSQFTRGVDDIDLGAIDANIHMAGNQAFSFGGATAQAYGVWSSVLDGNQVVRADVNGDRVADLEIRVDGWSSLTASDFVL